MGSSKVTKIATRGTPQGGVLSPLLWILVVNNLLRKCKQKNIKIVAYADDIMVLVSGKCLPTISDIMQSALGFILNQPI